MVSQEKRITGSGFRFANYQDDAARQNTVTPQGCKDRTSWARRPRTDRLHLQTFPGRNTFSHYRPPPASTAPPEPSQICLQTERETRPASSLPRPAPLTACAAGNTAAARRAAPQHQASRRPPSAPVALTPCGPGLRTPTLQKAGEGPAPPWARGGRAASACAAPLRRPLLAAPREGTFPPKVNSVRANK